MTSRSKSYPQTEAGVQRACLDYLKAMRIPAWRQNTGTAVYYDRRVPAYGGSVSAVPRRVAYGYPGSADITGILPDGRRLEIECKSARGRQTPEQRRFQEMIERSGGVYVLVKSVDELINVIGV